jgi:hypothetical protein
MSLNLPSHYVSQFATNVQLLSQQKGSRLRETVMVGSHVGKQASPVDQFAPIVMQSVTGRFEAMGRVDAAVDRRWVFPSDFDLPQMIDHFDKLRLLTDPQSVYVQNAVNAAGRKFDQLILAAMNGTSYTGVAGGTSTALPTGQKVGVNIGGANSSLNVAKLKAGLKVLMANDLDMGTEQVYCAITAKEHDSLLNEVQIISQDFNWGDRPVLKEGRIQRFLGINFIHTELVEAVSTSNLVPLYCKSGVHLGIWNDISTDISQRKDLQGLPWQAYVFMTAGATRLEEDKVVQISCYNA